MMFWKMLARWNLITWTGIQDCFLHVALSIFTNFYALVSLVHKLGPTIVENLQSCKD